MNLKKTEEFDFWSLFVTQYEKNYKKKDICWDFDYVFYCMSSTVVLHCKVFTTVHTFSHWMSFYCLDSTCVCGGSVGGSKEGREEMKWAPLIWKDIKGKVKKLQHTLSADPGSEMTDMTSGPGLVHLEQEG